MATPGISGRMMRALPCVTLRLIPTLPIIWKYIWQNNGKYTHTYIYIFTLLYIIHSFIYIYTYRYSVRYTIIHVLSFYLTSFWHIRWHSIRHSFWHLFWFWHSFWNSFWRYIWHLLWHYLWHAVWHLFNLFWHSIWQFYLACSLTFYLAISLASISLAFYPAHTLLDISHDICCANVFGIHSGILFDALILSCFIRHFILYKLFPAFYLAYVILLHSIWHFIWHSLWHSIWHIYILTIHLDFVLMCVVTLSNINVLTRYLPCILSSIYSDWHFIIYPMCCWYFILHTHTHIYIYIRGICYMAFFLAINLAFYWFLSSHSLCHSIWQFIWH